MPNTPYIDTITVNNKKYRFYNIKKLAEGNFDLEKVPFSLKILLENQLRKLDERIVKKEDILETAANRNRGQHPHDIAFHPGRVLMQDFTGVPAVVDLAVMRDAVKDAGGDPAAINPQVPVDLVIDHSIQVDYYGTDDALAKNVEKEFERNEERYKVLKWAQKSFDNFRVVPPNSGICHQVNLEYLGDVVSARVEDSTNVLFPDTLVGTDSHTTMIDALGIMGWGVGGIEAEAVMLGQPYFMPIPDVVGFKMVGKLKPGITGTDLVLTVTKMLREHGVVGKFVEFFGPGMQNLVLTDRSIIANMSPEYGATMGFFPVDDETIRYLKFTGRNEEAERSEAYLKAQGMFYTGSNDAEYTDTLELDLSTVEPSLAGPTKPADRLSLNETAAAMKKVTRRSENSGVTVKLDGVEVDLHDGTVAIAAITSCTNTSSPSLMIGAGLVAKKAAELGMKVPAWVKTSLAPGSRVVIDYLQESGLLPHLETLGFNLAAFGCTTCIGNSGPLHPEIEKAVRENDLALSSVLSGNRNFEARVHQYIRGNFLASPLLVVVYALAGTINIDLSSEPVGKDANGNEVFIKDIWPEDAEVAALVKNHVHEKSFTSQYSIIFDGDQKWKALDAGKSVTYPWDPKSTYIRKPPFFDTFSLKPEGQVSVSDAYPLLVVGDTITTDHISPAGAVKKEYPAGKYLLENGVTEPDFNSYGSRRGNHEVMMRGTFGNIRVKNRLVHPKEGSYTIKFPEKEEMFIYDAAMKYQSEKRQLVVLAGVEYGTGSSRDWAAKGTYLLGVQAVIAKSYERIHRSNLVGMGVLPLQFTGSDTIESLGLTGNETFSIHGDGELAAGCNMTVTAKGLDGSSKTFDVLCRLDTEVDVDYYLHGGILQYVIRQLLENS
jgi:aconitate hydratase